MDGQFVGEGNYAVPDINKEYYYSSNYEKCKGFTRLMKLVLLSKTNPELVEQIKFYLLLFPEELNKQNEDGWTALMIASRNDFKEIVEVLLSAPEDDSSEGRNIQDNYGRTALMIATINGFKEIAKMLISTPTTEDDSCGAINIQDEYGYTALMIAILNEHEEIVEMLLAHQGEADLNLQNKDGETSSMLALHDDNPKIIRMLEEYEIEKLKEENKRLETIISGIRNLCDD